MFSLERFVLLSVIMPDKLEKDLSQSTVDSGAYWYSLVRDVDRKYPKSGFFFNMLSNFSNAI